MNPDLASTGIIRAGDRDGRNTIYYPSGELICLPGEVVLATSANWDVDIISPWRRILPKTVFSGFHGRASSKLYITSTRIVLIREIDEWRELADQLTPLGLPNAAAREAELKTLVKGGLRQFCDIRPGKLRVVSAKRYRKSQSMLDLRLMGDDSRQYGILIWKTDGREEETLSLIESRFKR